MPSIDDNSSLHLARPENLAPSIALTESEDRTVLSYRARFSELFIYVDENGFDE